jgi:hypothetical protein
MIQVTRLTAGSLIFLMTFIGALARRNSSFHAKDK